MIRIQLQSLAKLSTGQVHIAFQPQSEPEIEVIFSVGGIKLNGFLQIFYGGPEISAVRQYLSQSEIDSGLLWRQLACRLQFFQRLVQIALLPQSCRPFVFVPQIQSEVVVG